MRNAEGQGVVAAERERTAPNLPQDRAISTKKVSRDMQEDLSAADSLVVQMEMQRENAKSLGQQEDKRQSRPELKLSIDQITAGALGHGTQNAAPDGQSPQDKDQNQKVAERKPGAKPAPKLARLSEKHLQYLSQQFATIDCGKIIQMIDQILNQPRLKQRLLPDSQAAGQPNAAAPRMSTARPGPRAAPASTGSQRNLRLRSGNRALDGPGNQN